jgi:hypothetical protein
MDSATRRGNEGCTLANPEGEAVDASYLSALRFHALRVEKVLIHKQPIEKNVYAAQRDFLVPSALQYLILTSGSKYRILCLLNGYLFEARLRQRHVVTGLQDYAARGSPDQREPERLARSPGVGGCDQNIPSVDDTQESSLTQSIVRPTLLNLAAVFAG